MKNTEYILLIVLCLFGCRTQQPVIIEANPDNGLEPGACYFSILQNEGDEKENPFVLELIPPKYEDVEIKFSKTKVEKYSFKNGKHQFQAVPPHLKFIIRKTDISQYTTTNDTIGYIFCMIEAPPIFVTFSDSELLSKNNKVNSMKLQPSKIIKRYVKKKPKKLKENQFYFEGGYWTKPKRAIGGSHDRETAVLEIKKKLIELGYNLIENNVFDTDTRNALIDFQRKNGLKEGQLDKETLEKLGIKH